MGVELFGIGLLIVLVAGGFLFFTGAFGAATTKPGTEEKANPKHVYVENETRERIVGGEQTTDRVRAEAESDPDTEVRS